MLRKRTYLIVMLCDLEERVNSMNKKASVLQTYDGHFKSAMAKLMQVVDQMV